jgi:hypothetical protein
MWSTQEPVALFGAGMSGSGWERVSRILRSIAPLVGRAGGSHPVPTPLVASRGPGLTTGDR